MCQGRIYVLIPMVSVLISCSTMTQSVRRPASLDDCGTKDSMSTEERIQDCSRLSESSKKPKNVVWNLVARKYDLSSGKSYEIWRDSKSGLLWGDRLDSNYSH